MRRTLDETWAVLEARGEEMPRTAGGAPLVPSSKPRVDDEVLGFSVFRTRLDGEWSSLTLPRTFFGRSLVEHATFHDSDLSESVLCWNDFVQVDFSKAVLAGADLRASSFEGCSFDDASLRGADLRGSSFFGCTFARADLQGVLVERGASWLPSLSADQRALLTLTSSAGDEPPGG